MKKLLVMLAIVAAAVGVHAASFDWGGAIAAEDGNATANAGTVAYLLYSDSAFGSITEFNTSTQTTDGGGTVVQTHTVSSSEVASYVFTETYNNDWDKMNGYYAMVLVDGTKMYYNTFSVNDFVSATTPKQDYQINPDWGGTDWIGNPAKSGTVTGVPEPTSGLLMLVGLGALALRRRKA